jgi:hypothetical protein
LQLIGKLTAAMVLLVASCSEPGARLFSESENTLHFESDEILETTNEFGQGERLTVDHVDIIAIARTPEEDYVVQYFLPDEDRSVYYYGFLWRNGERFRTARGWNSNSRTALMRDYRERIYPQVQAAVATK